MASTFRVLPRYPVRVIGVSGLKATTINGVLQVGIDPTTLQQSSNPTAPGNYVILLNATTQELQIGQLSSIVANQAIVNYFASLPTTLPATPGIVWNNGGAISIS